MTDTSLLEAALEGLMIQKQRVESQIEQVRSMLGRTAGRPGRKPAAASATATVEGVAAAPRKRRTMSAAAKRRIAEAQRRRWAEYRKKQGNES
jgi:hypothetical protein